MLVLKNPEFENDDYLFRIDLDRIPTGKVAYYAIKNIDENLANYYEAKREAFATQNISPDVFAEFVDDRPSLRSLSQLESLNSTIYTVACERENRRTYKELLSDVRQHLKLKPSTRRCVVRLVNGFDDYYASELSKPDDVTCLNLIHYLSTGPKLVFRASDVKNELLVDILTVYEFFIKPVYSDYQNLQMSIYCSTTQGVSSWSDFVKSLKIVCS